MAEEHQLTRRELRERERQLAAEREAQAQAAQQPAKAAQPDAPVQHSSHHHAAESTEPAQQDAAPRQPVTEAPARRSRAHAHAAAVAEQNAEAVSEKPVTEKATPQPLPRRSRERLPAADAPVPPRPAAAQQGASVLPLLAEEPRASKPEPAKAAPVEESAKPAEKAQPAASAQSAAKPEPKPELKPEVTSAEKAAAVLPKRSPVAERVVAQNQHDGDGAPKGASFIRSEPVEKPETKASASDRADKDDADAVQLTGGVSTGPATASVLVLPSTPEQNFTLPLDSTGDVVLTTGSITLPQLTTDTGIIPAVFERDAGDPLADSSDRLPITDENRPISAVDTVRRYESDVILPSSPEHSRLNAAAVWLLVGAGVLIVAATAFVLLRIFG